MKHIKAFCKSWQIIFLLITSALQAHSIVFIHIGPELPTHLSVAVDQARLFNERCPIFLIANEIAIRNTAPELLINNVSFITCESLASSTAHTKFRNHPGHDMGLSGFWRYTSERFFYLEELIRQYNLTDVFHLESDIMLYTNLDDLLPVFKKHYNEMIGATFENDSRCVPGFLYIPNLTPIEALIDFFPHYANMNQSDMETLALFKDQYHKKFIDHLPIVVSEYALLHPLKAQVKDQASKEPQCYSNHIDDFEAIFDGAAWGIYLAGWDSRFHLATGPGIISKYNVFDPSFFKIEWSVDSRGRKKPLAVYQGKKIPILNLHITNKSMIKHFHSLNIINN